MFDNQLFSLNPIQFFALSCDCLYFPTKGSLFPLAQYEIPSTHPLTCEECFAKLALGWNEEGVGLQVQVNQPIRKVCYPEIEQGDSVELFFDTRDLKSSGFNTRFCHHFFFCLRL